MRFSKGEELQAKSYYKIISLDACARKCKEETAFECKLFAYYAANSYYANL